MKNINPFFKLALLGMAIGGVLGVVYTNLLPPFPVISDFADYDYIGKLIAEHGIYSPISIQRIIYPPLYPFFLAIIYFLFGHNYTSVYLIQSALVGSIGALCYGIMHYYTKIPRPLALATSIAIVFWPYMILYAVVISSEVLFIALLILSVILLLQFITTPTIKNVTWLAISMGLATLARPVALLLPMWIMIGSFILYKINWLPNLTKNHLRYGMAGLLIWLAVLAPWIISVGLSFQMWMPVASNLSFVFEKANQTLSYLPSPTTETSLTQVLSAKLHNVYLFWNPGATGYHIEQLLAYYPVARYAIIVYQVGFIGMVILALVSMRWSRQNYVITYIGVIILYFWALHTVLFPFPRYTLPVIPLTLILATYTLNQLFISYAKKS